jgi:hypothetical protein
LITILIVFLFPILFFLFLAGTVIFVREEEEFGLIWRKRKAKIKAHEYWIEYQAVLGYVRE